MSKQELEFDIVILGGGPAGLSAAIYAARGAVKTAIVDISMLGGQPTNYLEIENYPGFSMSGGFELMEKFEAHADKFGVEKFDMVDLQKITLKEQASEIETSDKIFKAKSIILATGAQARKLGIPGEKELAGMGVSYCAVCDGAFFREKEVTVIGGGNAAIEEAMYLTKFASKVNVVHRRCELRADKIVQERAFANKKMNFIWDSIPVEIQGKTSVESIVLKNVKTGELEEVATQGVFPYIGFAPNSDDYADQVECDYGFVKTDENMETSIKSVFAAGDVRVTPLRQVITAASDGAIAATSAILYLDEVDS